MGNSSTKTKNTSRFDHIFKENMRTALPFIFKTTTGLDISTGQDLPTDVQYTKERRPDMLRRVRNDKGKECLLHVEYQTGNDYRMPLRTVQYNVRTNPCNTG
jgi:hypothetical protein